MVAPIKINQNLWRDKGHCGLIAASLQEWSFFFLCLIAGTLCGCPGAPGFQETQGLRALPKGPRALSSIVYHYKIDDRSRNKREHDLTRDVPLIISGGIFHERRHAVRIKGLCILFVYLSIYVFIPLDWGSPSDVVIL